jgi:hypothetical protein
MCTFGSAHHLYTEAPVTSAPIFTLHGTFQKQLPNKSNHTKRLFLLLLASVRPPYSISTLIRIRSDTRISTMGALDNTCALFQSPPYSPLTCNVQFRSILDWGCNLCHVRPHFPSITHVFRLVTGFTVVCFGLVRFLAQCLSFPKVTCVQTWYYYSRYPSDPWYIKLLVSSRSMP